MKDTPNSQVLTGLRAVIADKENELGLLRGTLAILAKNPTVTLESVITPVPAKPVKTTATAIAPVKKAKANIMSDEGRERVREAQRKRWAKIHREKRAAERELAAKMEAKAAARKAVKKPAKPVVKAAAKPAPKPIKPAPKLPAKPTKQPMKPAAVKAVRMSDSIPTPSSASAA
jgi:hypothetical protein